MIHYNLCRSLLHRWFWNLSGCIIWDGLSNSHWSIKLFLSNFILSLILNHWQALIWISSYRSACKIKFDLTIRIRVINLMLRNNWDASRYTIDKIITRIIVQLKLSHSNCTSNLFVTFHLHKLISTIAWLIISIYYIIGVTTFTFPTDLILFASDLIL